jgi:imidazole glycerol-phosphate synthase subunit HisH
MIAIIDYGMGNVRSLYNAFQYIGSDSVVTADHMEIRRADRIVLPGVGAFGDAVNAIRLLELDQVLDSEVRRGGKPMLGICLGMQLLANSSNEHGIHAGLGWLDAEVERFDLTPGLKIPHIGWNEITFAANEPLFNGLREAERNFYFVHSFHMRCRNSVDVIATCDYGGRFTAAVKSQNFIATQFHPEKSQDSGIRILQNFVRWNP